MVLSISMATRKGSTLASTFDLLIDGGKGCVPSIDLVQMEPQRCQYLNGIESTINIVDILDPQWLKLQNEFFEKPTTR
jgi:hypothetical protein